VKLLLDCVTATEARLLSARHAGARLTYLEKNALLKLERKMMIMPKRSTDDYIKMADRCGEAEVRENNLLLAMREAIAAIKRQNYASALKKLNAALPKG
jgi:hypothetical protein